MTVQDKELKKAMEGAIYREIGASNFYVSISEMIKNPEGKKRFLQLSKDEEGHRIKLESWFERLFGEGFKASTEGIKESEIKGFEIDEMTGALKALGIAIEAEARANEFYSDRAEKADDPELKKLFLDLAEEERGHYNLLEAERNSLIGGFYWFDMDSSSFLED